MWHFAAPFSLSSARSVLICQMSELSSPHAATLLLLWNRLPNSWTKLYFFIYWRKMKFEIDTTPCDVHSATLRPMLCNMNTLTRADGSALFTQGNCTANFSFESTHEYFWLQATQLWRHRLSVPPTWNYITYTSTRRMWMFSIIRRPDMWPPPINWGSKLYGTHAKRHCCPCCIRDRQSFYKFSQWKMEAMWVQLRQS